MPLYLAYVGDFRAKEKANFIANLPKIHAERFGTDPKLVRIQFIVGDRYKRIEAQHNSGFMAMEHSGPKGAFIRFGGAGHDLASEESKSTDCLVVKMPFYGTAEEWQGYCREVVGLWGKGLRSVYLQRVDLEFEVLDKGKEGIVLEQGSKEKAEGEGLPSYAAAQNA